MTLKTSNRRYKSERHPVELKKKVVSGIGVGESKILIDATILEDMGE